MTNTEIVIIGILAAWFIACILYAVFNNKMAKYTNRWDIFRLVSAYQLFSGEQRQYRLFYRDKLQGKATTDWQEIPLVPPYKWYHFAWFPQALAIQVITSATDDLITLVKARQDKTEAGNLTDRAIYKTVLRFVFRFPHKGNATERQFRIEETSGYVDGQKPRYVFTSAFHKR